MDVQRSGIGRRAFLRLGAGGAIGALIAGCEIAATRPAATPAATAPSVVQTATPAGAAAAASDVVRLSSVVIPQESGLYTHLLPEFERRTGHRVEITTAQDVYGPARTGKFDIVLSHYQHEGVRAFVQDGFGEWPRMVFSSPLALVGPPGDPAGIRGLTDVVEAFRRIGRSGAAFVVNDQDGLRYVSDVISRAADLTTSGGWYVDKATRGPDAMRAAAQAGGYTMWGLVPFLRLQQQSRLSLAPLLTQDQLLRSVMATVVVAPKAGATNVKGARSLQQFLMEAETQAKIRTFRMAGVPEQLWWPAAHDNEKGLFGNWP